MSHINIEIKARSTHHDRIRSYLKEHNADFRGTDHQIDTYFVVPHGRLKLREGNIENKLIHYERQNQAGPKQAIVTMFTTEPGTELKSVLTKALSVLAIVDKQREIYFIDNVKFHIDTVKDLGTFMEIEAIDKDGRIGREHLQAQCDKYMRDLDIKNADLLEGSYSDMITAEG